MCVCVCLCTFKSFFVSKQQQQQQNKTWIGFSEPSSTREEEIIIETISFNNNKYGSVKLLN